MNTEERIRDCYLTEEVETAPRKKDDPKGLYAVATKILLNEVFSVMNKYKLSITQFEKLVSPKTMFYLICWHYYRNVPRKVIKKMLEEIVRGEV